jgi:hypothetical protein
MVSFATRWIENILNNTVPGSLFSVFILLLFKIMSLTVIPISIENKSKTERKPSKEDINRFFQLQMKITT